MSNQLIQNLGEAIFGDDDVYYGIKSICINAMAKVYPEAPAYADDYRKILETYTILKWWERWKQILQQEYFPTKKIPVGFNPNGIFYCPLGLLTEQYGAFHMYCVYAKDSQVYDGGAS